MNNTKNSFRHKKLLLYRKIMILSRVTLIHALPMASSIDQFQLYTVFPSIKMVVVLPLALIAALVSIVVILTVRFFDDTLIMEVVLELLRCSSEAIY